MKKLSAVLLLVNIALVAALVSSHRTLPTTAQTAPKVEVDGSSEERMEDRSTNQFHWAEVESEDYRKYITNLRRISCPEETIRDIIIADVNKLYAARRSSLFNAGRPGKSWWQARQPRWDKQASEMQQIVRELEAEKRTLLRDLLGIDLVEESEKYALGVTEDSWQLDSVPPEKREAVRALLEKFDLLQRSLLEETEGPTEWQKLREAYQSREAELTRLLSPKELEEFQLRNDEVAESLRHHLAGFHASEQEFRELFRALKQHESQFAYTDPNDENLAQQNRAGLERSNEHIKSFLGEQRYAEYQRAQSYEFQNLFWLTQQYELPEESATKIFDTNKSARERWAQLQSNPTISEEQKAAGLRQLQEELQATIKGSLGDRAYRYFQHWDNSHWLQN